MSPGHSPRSPLLWLALPGFLVAMVVFGLAASAESRSEFEERTADGEQGGSDDDGGQGRSDRLEPADRDGGRLDGDPTGRGEPTRLDGRDIGDISEIAIVTEDGDVVVIQVDDEGRPVLLTEEERGSTVEIDPDDLVAVRLGQDGQLEVVPLDEVRPDDTILVPNPDGFDLVRPDGSRVEFRRDGENGGVTATEVAADGEATELRPNPDGSVTLSDGTTIGPVDFPDEPGMIDDLIDRTRDFPWPWVAAGVALLATVSIAIAVYLHRTRPRDDLDLARLFGTDGTTDHFDAFLASLLADPDPNRAIRLGFSVAEAGLGGTPRRHRDETPFEWHRRVEELQPGRASTVGQLCDLFARARFVAGGAGDEDRRAMVEALRQLASAEAPAGIDQTQPGPVPPDQTQPDQTQRDQTQRDQTQRDQTQPDQTQRDQTQRDQTRPGPPPFGPSGAQVGG